MRKLAITLALASTALSTPVLAKDDAWYVGIEGGAMIVEDIDFDIGATADAGTVDHNYGWDVGGTIGYDFGGFRAEAEVSYRQAGVDAYRSTLTTPAYNAAGAIVASPAGTYDYAGGKTSALSFMVNGLLDFGEDDGVQGFIGGGVGVARVKGEYALNTRGAFLDDSDTVFAWQALAGIRQPISENVDVTLKYRFFNADNVRLVDVTGRTAEGRFRSHSIMGGVTFNFGAPTPPPPPRVFRAYSPFTRATPTPPPMKP
ncbi:outer membrane protein, partial [Sphingomonas turrisvirgatae]